MIQYYDKTYKTLNTMETLERNLRHSYDWAMNRIHTLSNQNKYKDAEALEKEFKEWLNPLIEEHNIFSLKYIGDIK